MSLDQKILNEISRYNSINKYIMEQEVPVPPAEDPEAIPPTGEDMGPAIADPALPTPPVAPEGGEPEEVDVDNDPDVEVIGDEGEEGTEELDITDLVDSQKTMADKQEEYFENLFGQIKKMEEKLAEMDGIVSKLDTLETKIEKYRPKTAQEKLELRSLDSGPYKQNLADFFKDKEEEMEKTGKNEYVLTQGDVENFSPSEIEKTFNEPMEDEDDILLNRYNS